MQLCFCLCLKQPTLPTVSTHTASWFRLEDKLIASIKETATSLWQDWNATSLYLPKVRLCKCFSSLWWLGQNFSKWSSAEALANCLTKLFERGELLCQASASWDSGLKRFSSLSFKRSYGRALVNFRMQMPFVVLTPKEVKCSHEVLNLTTSGSATCNHPPSAKSQHSPTIFRPLSRHNDRTFDPSELAMIWGLCIKTASVENLYASLRALPNYFEGKLYRCLQAFPPDKNFKHWCSCRKYCTK